MVSLDTQSFYNCQFLAPRFQILAKTLIPIFSYSFQDEWESTKQIRSMTFDDWGDDAESVVNWDGSSAGGVVGKKAAGLMLNPYAAGG